MKKLYYMIAVGMLTSSIVFSGTAFAGKITDRQVCQQERIHEGVVSGDLNPRELVVLEREQHRIQCLKKRVWRDGRLTPGERALLMHEQDLSSIHIYRLKHNGI